MAFVGKAWGSGSLLATRGAFDGAVAALRAAPQQSAEEAVVNVLRAMNGRLSYAPDGRRGAHEWTGRRSFNDGTINGCVESAKIFFSLFHTAYPAYDVAYVDAFNSGCPNAGHAVIEVTGSDKRPYLIDATRFEALASARVKEPDLGRVVDFRPDRKGVIKQWPSVGDVFLEKAGGAYRSSVYEYQRVFDGKLLKVQDFRTLGELNAWLDSSDPAAKTPITFDWMKKAGLVLPFDDDSRSSFKYPNACAQGNAPVKHVIYGCYRELPDPDPAEQLEPDARSNYAKSGLAVFCGTGSGKASELSPGRRKKAMGPDSAEFVRKFESIKPGMTQEYIIKLLGEPTAKDFSTWTYYKNRMPLPGEQLAIYQIQFRNDKVSATDIAPGPDATGEAPRMVR